MPVIPTDVGPLSAPCGYLLSPVTGTRGRSRAPPLHIQINAPLSCMKHRGDDRGNSPRPVTFAFTMPTQTAVDAALQRFRTATRTRSPWLDTSFVQSGDKCATSGDNGSTDFNWKIVLCASHLCEEGWDGGWNDSGTSEQRR